MFRLQSTSISLKFAAQIDQDGKKKKLTSWRQVMGRVLEAQVTRFTKQNQQGLKLSYLRGSAIG